MKNCHPDEVKGINSSDNPKLFERLLLMARLCIYIKM